MFCFLSVEGLVLWIDSKKKVLDMRRVLKRDFAYESLVVLR